MKKAEDNTISLDDFFRKFFEAVFVWAVKPNAEEELKKADVIIVPAFGLRENDLGLSNKELAKITQELHEKFNLPVVLQWEVVSLVKIEPIKVLKIVNKSLGNQFNDFFSKIITRLFTKGLVKRPEDYLDTYGFFEQAAQVCLPKKSKVIIVCHKAHSWKCKAVAEKVGFKPLFPSEMTTAYDPESLQYYTRNSFLWWMREIPGRIYYILRGWI